MEMEFNIKSQFMSSSSSGTKSILKGFCGGVLVEGGDCF